MVNFQPMKKDALASKKGFGLSSAEMESSLQLREIYNKLGIIMDEIVGRDAFLIEIINSSEVEGATLFFDLVSNMGTVLCSAGARKFKSEERSGAGVFMKSTSDNVGWRGIYKVEIYTEECAKKEAQERLSYERDDPRLRSNVYVGIKDKKRILVKDNSEFSEIEPSGVLRFLNSPNLKIIPSHESSKLFLHKQMSTCKLIRS